MSVSAVNPHPVEPGVFAAIDEAATSLGYGDERLPGDHLDVLARAVCDALLTEEEQHAMSLSAELASACKAIITEGSQQDYDLAEFTVLIHGIQCRILAQAASRAFPHLYRPLGGRV